MSNEPWENSKHIYITVNSYQIGDAIVAIEQNANIPITRLIAISRFWEVF